MGYNIVLSKICQNTKLKLLNDLEMEEKMPIPLSKNLDVDTEFALNWARSGQVESEARRKTTSQIARSLVSSKGESPQVVVNLEDFLVIYTAEEEDNKGNNVIQLDDSQKISAWGQEGP